MALQGDMIIFIIIVIPTTMNSIMFIVSSIIMKNIIISITIILAVQDLGLLPGHALKMKRLG